MLQENNFCVHTHHTRNQPMQNSRLQPSYPNTQSVIRFTKQIKTNNNNSNINRDLQAPNLSKIRHFGPATATP